MKKLIYSLFILFFITSCQNSNLTEKEKELIRQITVKAGKCLGIKTGTIKGDIVLVKGKPYIIEIASRLSGGWMSSDQIKMSTGIDFLKLAIKLSLGDNSAKP